MGVVVFFLCISAVLADNEPCIQLESTTIDRFYKKGEALGTDHMLAIDDIHQAYKNNGQEASQIALLGGNSVSSLSSFVMSSCCHLDSHWYYVGPSL
ncbi:hypothetical protein Y032_0031g2403 [Ancylostoma ceylanicum]|uniref:Uncharacterized protein n=1 Tax=Ancylostoma ceylanicum TaxID=53326 RepID=A0A016UQX5_9BILA|nr:hypothetical protein Y032_0031g2403 [Ancylostoma ceylanicum]